MYAAMYIIFKPRSQSVSSQNLHHTASLATTTCVRVCELHHARAVMPSISLSYIYTSHVSASVLGFAGLYIYITCANWLHLKLTLTAPPPCTHTHARTHPHAKAETFSACLSCIHAHHSYIKMLFHKGTETHKSYKCT